MVDSSGAGGVPPPAVQAPREPAEEYGDDVLYGRVRVHPPSIDFVDVERGVKYVMRVTVKNVSHRNERIRFVAPPVGSGFTMRRLGTATIAPGIEVTADVEFILADDDDFHSALKIDVSGHVLEVPMRAFRPRAELHCETTVAFGPVVHEQAAKKKITLTNTGKRPGLFSFDVAMVEASTGEEVKLTSADLSESTLVRFVPDRGEVAPGQEVSVRVELTPNALGPARALARLAVEGGVAPALIDVTANVLLQRVELLDKKGVLMPPKLDFGNLYAGLAKKVACTLVNNGPKAISFALATLRDDDIPQDLAEDESLDHDKSDAVFGVSPADGIIEPFGSMDVAFSFSPPPNPPSKAGFRATRAEMSERPPPRFAVAKRLSVLETSQSIDVVLDGCAVTPDVRLSRASIQFAEPCKLYEHVDTAVTITNGNREMPVDFSFSKVANFRVAPASGRLAPGGSRDVLVSFEPRQQGAISKVLKLFAFKGAVLTLPVDVSGVCQGTSGRRKTAGGPLALPEDFEREPNFGPTTIRPLGGGITTHALRGPVGDGAERGGGRKTVWHERAEVDMALATGLPNITKRRTFAEQSALNAALDRKGVEHTGFELTPRELEHRLQHKDKYVGFLRESHAERAAREASRFVRPVVSDLAAFELGVDLGMASLSARGEHPLHGGWAAEQPTLELPRAKEPLWLDHPYDIDGEPIVEGKGNKARGLLFDDRKLIRRKHKLRPSSHEEVRDCNMSLPPKDLLLVPGGPKTIDFGTVSVFTAVHRSFNLANDLLTHVLVSVDAAEEEELKQSTPESQVIPPNGIAGFDIIFSSPTPTSFRRTVSYTINDRYSYKFSVVGEVVPIELELSTDELRFAFPPDNLDPTLTLPVKLTNHGTFRAAFECRGPAVSSKRPIAFEVTPERGAVEPGKSLEVQVAFTPLPGAAYEHMLTFVVEGGPSRTLLCKAELDEAKLSADVKKLDFGLVALGLRREMTVTLKNTGVEPTVFYWESPPPGLTLAPAMERLGPGASAEVVFELAPASAMRLDTTLSAHVRGGRPVRLHVTADAQLPDVLIAEDEFEFGTVTVGAKVARTLTIENTGALVALLDLKLTQHPGFDLAYTPPPARDDTDDEPRPAGEDEADTPLQLLSEALLAEGGGAGARGKRNSINLGASLNSMIGTDDEDDRSFEVDDRDNRDYRISVAPGARLQLAFTYTPTEVASHAFELPLALAGLAPSPQLRRAVTAESVATRMVLSPLNLDLGPCIIRARDFPYDAHVTLQNVDPSRKSLRWELATHALPSDGLVEIEPTEGVLHAGEQARIRVRFRPDRVCALDGVGLPVYLDADRRKPYLQLELSARGVRPRLTFDRSEVVLPPVPLGFTASATFLVINDGYDNLELQHKLPADTSKVPLRLSYPEGNMIGLAKEALPIVLSFSSKKPMAFTARVLLIDTHGRRYGIDVSASTDNSLFTVQPWLGPNRAAYEVAHQGQGRPLMLVPADAGGGSMQKRRQSRSFSRGVGGRGPTANTAALARSSAPVDSPAAGTPPVPPVRPQFPADAELARAVAAAEAEAAVLLPWVKNFLYELPTQRPFPGGLIAARGRPLIDILESVSGKNVAHLVPRDAQAVIGRPAKSRVALARALWQQYDALITFLKSHGALLPDVHPEYLLSRDDFLRWHSAERKAAAHAARLGAAKPPPTSESAIWREDKKLYDGRPVEPKLSEGERRELTARHKYVSLTAWSAVFYQLIKVFVASRLTPKALRGTPGVAEVLDRSDDFESGLAGSNVYSVAEGLLLHWVSSHWRRAAPELALGPLARITSFEQLRNGHVLGALLLSHAPFLRTPELAAGEEEPEAEGSEAESAKSSRRSAGAVGSRRGTGDGPEAVGSRRGTSDGPPPPTAEGRARRKPPGCAIDALHPLPCSAEERARNVTLCVEAMTQHLGLERPPSVETFLHGTERDLALAVLALYHTLPHYVPKATIDFAGALHEQITKSIELSNSSRKPIVYAVRVEGSNAFELPLGRTVRIEPRTTLAYPVTFASRFAADASARLLFLSRGDGNTTAHATSLAFILTATITSKRPHKTLALEGALYQVREEEVVVTNPFDELCTFAISLSEERPALDRDPAATGAALGDGHSPPPARRPSMRPPPGGPSGAQSLAASSKAAGPVDRLTELERSISRLPSAFHIASADPRRPEVSLTLAPGASTSVRLQFLPFMLGQHSCEISFLDERRGEFVYVVTGTGLLPPSIDTISLKADAATSATLEFELAFKNEALEKARSDALRRLAKVRDKDMEKSREALRAPPLYFKLEFSGTFFQGPPFVELLEAKGLRRRATSTEPGQGPPSGAETPLATGQMTAGSAASANLVRVQFNPKRPGMYTSKLVLYSPLDVRVYDLAGTAPAPGTRATLEFAAPARRSIRQEIPVVNNSPLPWELTASLSGEYFRGSTSLRVPAGRTEQYVLEFAPEWMCKVEGELVLSNATTGDRFAYALVGVGEEPLAEGTVVLDVQARSKTKHEFGVFNPSADGKECKVTVESDLMHVSGEPTVKVPARSGAVPFGRQEREDNASRRQSAVPSAAGSRRGSTLNRQHPSRYALSIAPQLGGAVHGSITFKAPDGRYLWYTVEIRASPPPAERTIEVGAVVRKGAAVEVEVVNPLGEAVEFQVDLEGEGLVGEPTLRIGPGPDTVARYELIYSPLTAGVGAGAVSFINAQVGEFWYKLLLKAEKPAAEELPELQCELGKTAEHVVRVDNPINEPISLRSVCSNTRNWMVGTKRGGPLTLPPFGSTDVVMQYSPSALGEAQEAKVVLTHPRLAEWTFHLTGVGTHPTRMPAIEVVAELGTVTSGAVNFVNPFDRAIGVSVRLEQPAGAPAFALLLRRTTGIVVESSAKLQASFTFSAEDMQEHEATVVISVDDDPTLVWVTPIVALAESRPSLKPYVLSVKARQQLQTMLELPLDGLELGGGRIPGPFAIDIQEIPEEHAALIASSLRMEVAGTLSPQGVLPVAVQWLPLRPLKTTVAIVLRQPSGGRWKYELTLNASTPEVDDLIRLESTLNKTATVAFTLNNAFDTNAEFTAGFTAESSTVFNVRPIEGVLPRASADGQTFYVSFTPYEYGKVAEGTLLITTAEMQWSYEVRGEPPVFALPEARKKVDDRMDPEIDRRRQAEKRQHKNFMRKNMAQTGAPMPP